MIPVENFDAPTVERMLQFIYQGDYSVANTSDTLQNGPPETSNASGITKSTATTATATSAESNAHVEGCYESADGQRRTIHNEPTAHALVYSIADHYEIHDLETLALAKFKKAKVSLDKDSFLELANFVYGNPDKSNL